MKYNTTSSLFHYTKCLEDLKGILLEGLLPNYCKESFSYNEKTEQVGIPMVSFCDIPVTRASGFCDRYGKYAIGLSKEWGLKNRINPVFYNASEEIVAGLWYYRNYQKSIEDRLKKRGSDGKSLKLDLSVGEKPELVDFFNNANAKSANLAFYGLIKKYESEHNGINQNNYIENEWRYVVHDGEDNVVWLWGEEAYKIWRGTDRSKPEPSNELRDKRLQFEVPDVRYIIVENEADIVSVIGWLEILDVLGGNQSLTEDDKKLLISRVISMDQIEQDF